MSRRKFKASFVHAFEGIIISLREERNLRVHFVVALGTLSLGFLLRLTGAELAILFLTACLVIAAEMFNTAIERIVDLTTNEIHPLAKIAKDVAAGAVLVSALSAVGVACCVLLPPLTRELSCLGGLEALCCRAISLIFIALCTIVFWVGYAYGKTR